MHGMHACPPHLQSQFRMVLNHHMHVIYIAIKLFWYIKYFIGQAHNISNNPHQILRHVINNLKNHRSFIYQIFDGGCYVEHPSRTVVSLSHNWTMDYALNCQFCAKWVSPKFFSGTRLQKTSPLVEAYKSYFEAFHESLEITRSHRVWLVVELIKGCSF